MTGPTIRGSERGTRAPSWVTGTSGAVGVVLVVLALGLALRLIIAYVLPGSGFGVDLGAFRAWASNLATEGLFGFYQRDFFHDYTPGYLYVLWVLGMIGEASGGVSVGLIKIPAILADLAIGWLVWSMILELGGRRSLALGAAFVSVVNPISWFDSVVWGQVDSVGVVFLLLGLREIWRDRPERAAILTVVAALIKPQLGILIPILALVTIRRAFWPADDAATTPGVVAAGAQTPAAATTGGAPAGWRARFLAAEARTDNPLRILTTGLAALGATILLCLPFGLSVLEFSSEAPYVTSGLLSQIFATASGYPYLTVNAFNPWALVLGDSGNSLANSGLWVWDGPWGPASEGAGSAAFGPIPAVLVGSALMLAVVVIVSVVAAWRPDRLTILLSLTVLALAFYVVPTRVHERYAYPFFALAIILAAISWRWRPAYILASVTVFLNMYAALTNPFYDNPGVRDWLGIGPASRSFEGVAVIAVLNGLVFAWVMLQLRADARARLTDELASEQELALEEALALPPGVNAPGRRRPASSAPTPAHASPVAALSEPPATPFSAAGIFPDASPTPNLGRKGSAAAAATGTTAASSLGSVAASALGSGAANGVAPPTTRPVPSAARPSLPTWTPRASFEETGITGWFRSRFNERPIRPDRTATLRSEGGGRLDRMDLLLIVVLVVSTLLLRTFRLAEPYQMHFDEVYHARTATEFLQSWRYGISHDIYEWTHPHLAKYAMAGGLVAWGGDSVQSTSDLGVPVVAATVEPRRIDELAPGQRAGERLHVATGTEIRTYDLTTRDLISVVPAPDASAVAVDELGKRLVIGYSDGRPGHARSRPDRRWRRRQRARAGRPRHGRPADRAPVPDRGRPVRRRRGHRAGDQRRSRRRDGRGHARVARRRGTRRRRDRVGPGRGGRRSDRPGGGRVEPRRDPVDRRGRLRVAAGRGGTGRDRRAGRPGQRRRPDRT